MVSINGGSITGADFPFGGVKHSGLGREWGEAGIRAGVINARMGIAALGSVTNEDIAELQRQYSGRLIGAGTVRLGTNVQPAYFDQMREALDPEKTVMETGIV